MTTTYDDDRIRCPECDGVADAEECIGPSPYRTEYTRQYVSAEPCSTCGGEGWIYEFECGECGAEEDCADVGCRECADKHSTLLCAECAKDPGIHSSRCESSGMMLVECGDCDKMVPYNTTSSVREFTDRVCASCMAERKLAENIQPPEAPLDLVAAVRKWAGIS